MNKSDELKLRSADNLQIYGAYLGGNDCGAQDYTKAIQLRGVRIVDAKWLEALAGSHDELLEALERMVKLNMPLTGAPSHAELVEFWEYEKTQGRGEADDQLFVLAAIAKARGEV